MKKLARVLFAHVALASLLLACSGPGNTFLKAKNEGDRANDAGRYDEAARAYHHAAEVAGRSRDRDWALMMEASTLARAGRITDAMAAYDNIAAVSPKGERTPRALFERALLEIRHGNAEQGWASLEKTLERFRDEGSSRKVFAMLIQHYEEKAPGTGGLSWLDEKNAAFAKGPLRQEYCYHHAKLVEATGKLRQARDEYVACAKLVPYPEGSLTDDAWWRASELDEKLGDAGAAIADLQAMLEVREPTKFAPGSYERPRFPPAQFRLAELYRDHLHDDAKARQEFRRCYDMYATSILRDDALWQEALLAKKAKEDELVCDRMNLLVNKHKDSRFAACADKLCASVKPPEGKKCRRYIDPSLSPEEREKPDLSE